MNTEELLHRRGVLLRILEMQAPHAVYSLLALSLHTGNLSELNKIDSKLKGAGVDISALPPAPSKVEFNQKMAEQVHRETVEWNARDTAALYEPIDKKGAA